ncbi:MAG: hypothetical protein OXK81_08830, partial [Chloroflexota bacterium]|nr:hypothetical protein [Chloroflexota bacterium]
MSGGAGILPRPAPFMAWRCGDGGEGGAGRRNPRPEPAVPSETLRYRGCSPGRPELNRTAVEQVQA